MIRFFLLKSGLSIYGDGAAKYTVNSILSLRRAELACVSFPQFKDLVYF